MSGLCDECGAMWQRCHCGANGEAHREVARLAVENRAALARIATLERELAEARQMLKEQEGRTPMLDAMERVAGDVVALADAAVVSERDTLREQLAAVTAERDALAAERVMFCAVVDSLTAERDDAMERVAGASSRPL